MKYTASIKNDDKTAFERVYFENYEKLYSYYLRKTSSVFLAEELSQETFIKLWVYRKSISEEIPIAAQIFRIAKTIFIDTLKKKRFTTVSIEEGYCIDFKKEDQNIIEQKEFAQLIANSIDALPRVRKQVFKLSRESGLSHIEIAQQLAISPKSVNNHITKAIQQLKRLINTNSLYMVFWLNYVQYLFFI